MKLATLREGGPDGTLIVVSSDNARFRPASEVAQNLQQAIDQWDRAAPMLQAIARELDQGDGFALPDASAFAAPLPRAWQWLDGSAFKAHAERMDAALGLTPARDDTPLMYQGLSHQFYGPRDAVPFVSEAHGIDFEGEFGVITGPVASGASLEECRASIRLIVLINDWSLRGLAGREMATGFGWVQAKPPCSAAPFAVTPEQLGDNWRNARIGLDLNVWLDDDRFGTVNAGEMAVGFDALIHHAAATRPLCAGTIIGSGTVSNTDIERNGCACIAEQRAHETITGGAAETTYLRFGQRVRMAVSDPSGRSIFGDINQTVVRAGERVE